MVALVLLGAVTVATWWSAAGLPPAMDNVERARWVANATASVLSQVREAHSARRGYLLTGDQQFLDQYHRSVDVARRSLAIVDALTRSDPSQRPRVRRVLRLMNDADSLSAATIVARQQQGLEAAAAQVRGGGVQQIISGIADMLGEIERVERQRLAGHLRVARSRATQARRVAIGSAILAVVLLPVAALIIRADLRQRRERNRAMRAASVAAQDATRAKSEFLASMSHEIRTPLNGVLGMIELLLDTDLTHAQRDYLLTARSSAESLLRLLNDILDISRIEAGRLDFEVHPFALRDMVADTLRTLGTRAEKKGLELAYRVAPGVPDVLVGDPGRLQQVVANLVGNALKFTETGEIVVEIDAAPVGAHETELRVAVRDTGIGIPADRLGAVFDLFTQAESSTHRRFGGTGLGLSISQRLVHLMGGTIRVESEVGRGSTFHFTARLRVGEQADSPRAELAQLEGARVLVVDDHPTNRRILEEMLAQWRMAPESAATADDGLRLARDATADGRPFRLAVLDSILPDFDGYTLAERLSNSGALPGGAVVIMASDLQHGSVARRAALGIPRALLKPVKPSELLDALLVAAAAAPAPAVVPAASPHRWPGASVLVAEDNPVNQQVAQGLLERRGVSVTIAETGRAALELLASDGARFDLVLMDIEMPDMDGLEATRQFRALPQPPSARRTPIVALTAHALAQDRESCLAVGMDECLTKPVRPQELDDALRRYLGEPHSDADADALPRSGPMPVAGAPAVPGRRPSREVVLARMREFLGDDPELVRIIAREFVRQTPALVAQLRQAVNTGSAAEAARLAHRLKGSAGQIAADDLARRAGALEEQAGKGRLAGASDLLHEIEQEAAHIAVVLDAED